MLGFKAGQPSMARLHMRKAAQCAAFLFAATEQHRDADTHQGHRPPGQQQLDRFRCVQPRLLASMNRPIRISRTAATRLNRIGSAKAQDRAGYLAVPSSRRHAGPAPPARSGAPGRCPDRARQAGSPSWRPITWKCSWRTILPSAPMLIFSTPSEPFRALQARLSSVRSLSCCSPSSSIHSVTPARRGTSTSQGIVRRSSAALATTVLPPPARYRWPGVIEFEFAHPRCSEKKSRVLQRQGGAVWIIRMSDLPVEGMIGRIDVGGHLRQLLAVACTAPVGCCGPGRRSGRSPAPWVSHQGTGRCGRRSS